jgi:xanthine dehydrogenase molybdopterin-binding subunit B
MLRGMVSCTNAYHVPLVRCKGTVCKTNLSSSTAFRGFGAVQAMMICEQWVERIGEVLNMDAAEVSTKFIVHYVRFMK